MLIGGALLKFLSRDPGVGDYKDGSTNLPHGKELATLRREFPDLPALLTGKRVVDFGCGGGRQSVSLVKEVHCYVCGIDTNPRALQNAKDLAAHSDLNEKEIEFRESVTADMYGKFDVVISQNAMEHYLDPAAVLDNMKSLIHEKGKILITFGPPWLAPYGSHMHFFCRVPWLNILFSEKAVMAVRALYRNDGAKRYEDVESGLNKMTVAKFEKIVSESGLGMTYKKYSCIKGQDWLAAIPVIRELFINQVTCVLSYNDSKS
jgi:SAM-dependent methyltransferase